MPSLKFWISAFLGAFYGFVFFGLVLHSSANPILFGKFSFSHLMLLVGLVFAFVPLKSLLRYALKESSIALPEGRFFRFTPMKKMGLYFALFVGIIAPLETYLQSQKISGAVGTKEKLVTEFHPYLQNTLAAGDTDLHVNSHGFRGEEISVQKPENTKRVFFIGGSTVLCSRVDYESSHVRRIERMLNKRSSDKRIEVLNAGNHWHTTQHSLMKYLFYIKDFKPDVVVLWHGMNDLYRSCLPKEMTQGPFWADYRHHYGPIANMVKGYSQSHPGSHPPVFQSHFLSLSQLTEKLWSRMYTDIRGKQEKAKALQYVDFPLTKFKSLRTFARNLQSLAERLKMDGVQLVLATQPFLYRKQLSVPEKSSLWMRQLCIEEGAGPSIGSMQRAMEHYNRQTEIVARSNGLPLIDLESALPKTEEYFLDEFHYTKKGNQKVAETILPYLENVLHPSKTQANRTL